MKKLNVVCAALGLALIGVSPASAQSASKAGIMMSSASAIGVYVPLGDRISIRPQIAVQRTTTEPAGAPFESTITMLTPGVALLVTLKRWDDTRLYVSPQYLYSRANAETNGAESTGTAHYVNGMLGAQHALGSRFAVFGEVGMAWSTNQSKSSTGAIGTRNRAWATRSTVGGILFF